MVAQELLENAKGILNLYFKDRYKVVSSAQINQIVEAAIHRIDSDLADENEKIDELYYSA